MRIASLSASSAVLLAAGCGGGEGQGIPPAAADALAARSDRVAETLAQGDRCLANRLADQLVGDAQAAAVPREYRTPLLAAARSLASRIECPPPPPPPPAVEEDHEGGGKEKGGGKGHGKGKGGKD